ncbi:protein-disulfide reductase DsbD domain-containing protein [Sphingomonas sp. LY54]|nr:protein-disulfide reductase DsbD domain-containing protein [Sphingomonas sp. LY54]WRP27483.1 protein-disulfide reductase DsbD domain-containing protein [Sphingomonas sp. LY54]
MNRSGALMRAFLFALSLFWIGLTAPAVAQLPGQKAVAVELLAETNAPAAGETLTLALRMTPQPGWHGYWKNPGDAGVESRIDWTLPAGVAPGPIQYPVPQTLIIAGLMNYVYEGPYVQLVELKLPAGLATGTKLPLRGKYDFLACTDEICVPQSAELALDLTVGAPGAPRARQADFDRYRQALPKPLGSEAKFETANGRFRLAVPLPADMAVADPYFFPITDGALAYAAPQAVSRNGDMLIVETDAAGQTVPLVEGVLKIGPNQGLTLTARSGAVPAAGAALATGEAASGGSTTILAALGGALIGGLLLNIMPCVFPILSLKALSLAKAGGDERAARREALAYTAGVVLVCLALGGLLLALRAGGATAGWAFQLQDPRVILLLLLLVTAISLNLAGLFELPQIAGGERLARSGGASGAFWTGALAAFVATPCTGPFMGAALAAALVLPTAAALAVFAGLGLGLALPFLLLGFVPALRRMLPKPGAWMARLRRILSVPMFLTALGLAWILGRQSGVDGMAIGLAGALALALGLWWVGRRQENGLGWLPLAPAALAAMAAILLVPTASAPAEAKAKDMLGAEPFSEARLATLQSEGRPVFVYFTADWCVTCKVNEKTALERSDVADAFAARKVAVLVGDWTRGDAAIGRFLEAHGRSGVPLYLYYAPGRPARVLPQVLTTGMLTALPS